MNDQPTPPGPGGELPPQQSSLLGASAGTTERVQRIIEAAGQAAAGIIEDAEAQASAYLEESRQRAALLAEQRAREMWGLADSLIARAEAIRQQSDELLRSLDAARRAMDEALRGEIGGAPPPPAPPPFAPPAGSPPPASPQYAPQSQGQPAPVHHLYEAAPGSWQSQEPPAPASPSFQQEAPPPPQPEAAPRGAWAEAAPPPQPAPGNNQPSEGARLLATQMAVAGSSRAEIEGRLQHEFGIHETRPILDAILGPER